MIHIHQAIYGDADGAYSLLNSSFSNQDIPKRLGNATDLIDRPPEGVLSSPVLRGFLKDNYFLLIKSFPDISDNAKIRRGRVFSHVLFIELKDFLKIPDLSILLRHHLSVIDKDANMQEIEIPKLNSDSNYKSTSEGRIACAINGLVNHTNYDNTIAWIGENGYLDWINKIWPAIPNLVKSNLKLGVAFNPQKVDSTLLNLIYVPIEVKHNWSKTKYKLVELHAEERLHSQTANLIAGQDDKAEGLIELLVDFTPRIEEIDDLLMFEKMTKAYDSIKENGSANLKQLLPFADLVSKYNPNPKSGFTSKLNLLQAIISGILSADAKEINVINNPNWSGFEDAPNKLSSALTIWLDKNLFKKESGVANAPLIEKAIENSEHTWWETAVLDKIKSSFANWQDYFAKCIWDWFVTKPKLINKLKPILPEEAEIDFCLNLPQLPRDLATAVLELAQDKKWLQLHGIIASDIFSAQEAISRQLDLDTNIHHIQVFEDMANRIPHKDFISATVKIQEQRLYLISGKLCQAKPKFLHELQIKQIGWQEIWLETVKQGVNIWEGITDPAKTLHEILDHILHNHYFNEELLNRISISTFNDLSKYPNRKEIWNELPTTSKVGFLTATAYSFIKAAANKELSLNNLEQPLFQHIQTPAFINSLMADSNIAVSFKLKLFDKFPNFASIEAISLIDNNHFSTSESIILGQKILHRGWKPAATHLYSIIRYRPDLNLSIKECKGLLDISQRINLWLEGFSTQTITEEEWWSALVSKAINLYPQGPDQNGIWETAGGHNADLKHNATGKEKWNYALRELRSGGKPKREDLLKVMLKEFPNDELLKKLKKAI